MHRLERKVALITGGAAGLGKAVALRLVADGARVVISDIDAAAGEAAASELRCDFLEQDVTDEAQWCNVIQTVEQRHHGLHVLVNNAGIVGPAASASLAEAALTDWKRIFAVNVEGVLLGCRSAIPAIHASGGGSIVNISSIAAFLATPYAAAYGASKAAVRQLTKSVAQHCLERGLRIRCNSVHPGVVRTALWEQHAAALAERRGIAVETLVRESQAKVPMGDLVRPEDVSSAVAFLASDESRYITGAELIVDGGFIHCDTYRRELQPQPALDPHA